MDGWLDRVYKILDKGLMDMYYVQTNIWLKLQIILRLENNFSHCAFLLCISIKKRFESYHQDSSTTLVTLY